MNTQTPGGKSLLEYIPSIAETPGCLNGAQTLLKILRQLTTGFTLLGAHQVQSLSFCKPYVSFEVKLHLKDSVMAEHIPDMGHKIDLENAKVLRRGLRST
ncbi:LOW QUALITY PROTEIN: hypothetical protein T265_13689 [Opisthorchis viverrini]|uniref:Uncharacterized protein n=1 Tax=Opisthorchis viverrini TaxID=6198 RepID=A0A074ZQ18_OPIVI|nr:LOW QUALITY PROTEIN: hypothetical protein T265_13689 [Opisthorchis viverrini]KER27917.1 LOW QUALITY PROTEIN: hypothetical protein T265_13689 [Opisthorchis viverrini]